MYTKIKKAYNDNRALYIGGLGESILSMPLCFCTEKKTIAQFEKSAIRCHQGKCGVCAREPMCNYKCHHKMDKFCTAKALGL
jgi:hypothetical protein